MNDPSQQPVSRTTPGHQLVVKTLDTHPNALRPLHSRDSAEAELAALVVRAALHLDQVQKELVDRCTWAADDLTRVAAGATSVNSLGILQNSGLQIDLLAARRADATAHLKSVMAAYQSATTPAEPRHPSPPPAPMSTASRRSR